MLQIDCSQKDTKKGKIGWCIQKALYFSKQNIYYALNRILHRNMDVKFLEKWLQYDTNTKQWYSNCEPQAARGFHDSYCVL